MFSILPSLNFWKFQHQKTGNTDQNGPGPTFLYFVGDAGSYKKENIDGRSLRINDGLLVATLER